MPQLHTISSWGHSPIPPGTFKESHTRQMLLIFLYFSFAELSTSPCEDFPELLLPPVCQL